ncbi:kinase-like domain-containing protein [Cytidiella melzeri]|nr:kinase-like domain-containing protein [Cytidiella melzeri]
MSTVNLPSMRPTRLVRLPPYGLPPPPPSPPSSVPFPPGGDDGSSDKSESVASSEKRFSAAEDAKGSHNEENKVASPFPPSLEITQSSNTVPRPVESAITPTGVSFPAATCDQPSAVASSGSDVDQLQSVPNAGSSHKPSLRSWLEDMFSETQPIVLTPSSPSVDGFGDPHGLRAITPLPTPPSTPGTEPSTYLSSACSTPATGSSATSRSASERYETQRRWAVKLASVCKAGEIYNRARSFIELRHGMETYTVFGTLGVGASGKVMHARHNCWDVALKVMHKHMIYRRPSARSQILDELKALKRITEADLSFVCPLLSAWADEHNIYFEMPCLRENMFQRIKRLPLTRSEVRLYSAEMLHGLSNLHSAGIIHRDIKLENISFDVHGHIAFTDFGLARTVTPEDTETIKDVRMHGMAGTAGYWAPEMVCGTDEHGYGWEVDIWALGIVIYEMATNSTVSFYSGETLRDIKRKMMLYDVPVRRIQDSGLRGLLEHMLVRDPEQRWSAEHLKAHPYFHGKLDWKTVVTKDYHMEEEPGNAMVDNTPNGLRFDTFYSGKDERYPDLQVTPAGDIAPNKHAKKSFQEDEAAPEAFTFSMDREYRDILMEEFSEWSGEEFESRYKVEDDLDDAIEPPTPPASNSGTDSADL